MNQAFLPPLSSSADVVASASAVDGGARAFVIVILVITALIAIRSLRLMWEPVAEFVGMMLRVGAVAALAIAMLLIIIVLTIGTI